MNSTEILIDGIEYKVKKLIAQKKQLEKENENLRGEVEDLKNKNKDKDDIINDLEQKNEAIRLSKSLNEKDEIRSVHNRIDRLVREIDKSIGLLNKFDK